MTHHCKNMIHCNVRLVTIKRNQAAIFKFLKEQINKLNPLRELTTEEKATN